MKVCLWHAEQAPTQVNNSVQNYKNKNMAMLCTLWKDSCFLLNVAILGFLILIKVYEHCICVLSVYIYCFIHKK